MSCFKLSVFEDLFEKNDIEEKRAEFKKMARAAENAERYEDMCQFMKYLVENITTDLDVEERNLLSVAYKNVIGTRRASWRTLSADLEEGNSHTKNFLVVVEKELIRTCEEVLAILKKLHTSNTDTACKSNDKSEAQVFYLKMAGDYYRYLAESVSSSEEYPLKAKEYYQQANDLAENSLAATHPIRLGLALNFSVCHYEILKDQKQACELAKKAFDDAISKLDQLDEADYKDSTLIMQLLRDNLTLWTASEGQEDDVTLDDLSDEEN